MEKKSKKSMIIAMTVLLLVTLILLGLTYAYYRTRIIGNTNDKSISVTSKKLEITYADGNGIIEVSETIEPGYSVTKTFSVENTGSESASYSIKFDNINNTFQRNQDWTYILKEGETEVAKGTIVAGSYQVVVGQITLAAKEVDSYELTITYSNLTDVNQSEDMGKSLSLRVNIAENTTTWENAESGTLLYALKNDTLNTVTNPVTVPGKAPSGVTFTEADGTSSTTSVTATYQSSRYYAYADSYTFDEESGTYSLNNPKVATYAEVSTNLVNKYVTSYSPSISNTINTTGLTQIYLITSAPAASTTSSVTIGYTLKKVTTGTTTEAVLASTEDDYGTSYYFRGSVENNYVTYSGMCWRIVRVRGDGTIKLALADENGECNAETYSVNNTTSAFVDGRTDILYKYNPSWTESEFIYETSDIPEILETWSTKEITSEDGSVIREHNLDTSKLATTEWCNDTSVTSKTFYDSDFNVIYETDENFDDLLSYTDQYYGAYGRLEKRSTAEPSLKCNATGLNDTSATRYTSNIGILSADEIVFAGSTKYDSGLSWNYYLKTNATVSYWTLSPYYFADTIEQPLIWNVSSFGGMSYGYVIDESSVRPAVVLASNVTLDTTITGQNGTQSNPYVVD